jgi:anti-sigma B factor antagonist
MPSDDIFTIELDGDTVTMSGDLDAHTAPQLDDVVTTLIERGAPTIVLRMAEVDFVDSSGLRCMIRARNEGGGGRDVVIEDPSSATLRLLEVTALTEQFTIRSSS